MENDTSASENSEPSRLRPSKWQKKELSKMSDLTSNRLDGTFSFDDYQFLTRNDFNRYDKSSPYVAHAVISTDASGHKMASQYAFPTIDGKNDEQTPLVSPLTDIEAIERNGLMRYQAKGPDGKRWTAKRYEHGVLQDKRTKQQSAIDIAYFSEDDDDSDTEQSPSNKWGNAAIIPRFKPSSHSNKAAVITKGGHALQVEPASVLYRDNNKARGSEQNKVMDLPEYKAKREGRNKYNGHSARDAYELFFEAYESTLSAPMITLLKRAFQANIKKHPENQYRPEWLHGYGFSLTPQSIDPQQKENLGAASAWANTEMTILESLAKWFALNQNSSERIQIRTLYTMLEGSELIDTINFEASIQFQERILRFKQEIDAFKETPIFRKSSDVAQATGIAHALLHNISPISTMEVKPESIRLAKAYQQVPEGTSFQPYINDTSEPPKHLLIFDLETTSFNHKEGKIIEFGGLLVSFNQSQGILDCTDSYNGLQDPDEPLSDEVKDVTHITNEDLKDQRIDWLHVRRMIEQADYVVCHNSHFDRRFFETKAPVELQALLKTKAFGCTLQDIDWWKKGNSSQTLTNLNKRLGFTFTGHRAVNDCWATLNLLRKVDNAVPELISNIHKNTALICAVDAPYNKKDALKRKGFHWSDGETQNIPKCWHAYVEETELGLAKQWLDSVVYEGTSTTSAHLPQRPHITAQARYSERSELEDPIVTSSNAASASNNMPALEKRALESETFTQPPIEKKRKTMTAPKRKPPSLFFKKTSTTKLQACKEATNTHEASSTTKHPG